MRKRSGSFHSVAWRRQVSVHSAIFGRALLSRPGERHCPCTSAQRISSGCDPQPALHDAWPHLSLAARQARPEQKGKGRDLLYCEASSTVVVARAERDNEFRSLHLHSEGVSEFMTSRFSSNKLPDALCRDWNCELISSHI